MTSPSDLAEEIGQLYQSIKAPLDRTSPEALIAELEFRGQWLARSAELVAEAQAIHDRARGEAAEKYLDLSATQMRELVSRDCVQEAKLLKLAERLNSTLTHQIDEVRTIISFEKESRRYEK